MRPISPCALAAQQGAWPKKQEQDLWPAVLAIRARAAGKAHITRQDDVTVSLTRLSRATNQIDGSHPNSHAPSAFARHGHAAASRQEEAGLPPPCWPPLSRQLAHTRQPQVPGSWLVCSSRQRALQGARPGRSRARRLPEAEARGSRRARGRRQAGPISCPHHLSPSLIRPSLSIP